MEDTALQVNLEAARLIPTIRLRNLGGIVVIDFIDMQQAESKQQVLAVLKEAFASDPSQIRLKAFLSMAPCSSVANATARAWVK